MKMFWVRTAADISALTALELSDSYRAGQLFAKTMAEFVCCEQLALFAFGVRLSAEENRIHSRLQASELNIRFF